MMGDFQLPGGRVASKAVEVQELCKTYRTRRENRIALKSLTLEIPEGEIFGFAGPNGAGKSTALKILVGLVQATSGSVSVFGHQAGSQEARKLLGFLPEVTLYHDFMGAEELLGIHAHLAGLPPKEHKARIREVLENVGLWDRRASRLSDFSKGMKQRFGIAQAILGRPKLLVLDELTSGLDPEAQANLLQLICGFKEQGLTIFFSSHHLVEIEKVCDSVAILHRGSLRAAGTLGKLLGDGRRRTLRIRTASDKKDWIDNNLWRTLSDGSYACSVSSEDSGPLIDQVRAQGGELLELQTERQSLDSLFHQLTSVPEEVLA